MLCVCREEVGRHWHLLEEQNGETQEPDGVPGFVHLDSAPGREGDAPPEGNAPLPAGVDAEAAAGSGAPPPPPPGTTLHLNGLGTGQIHNGVSHESGAMTSEGSDVTRNDCPMVTSRNSPMVLGCHGDVEEIQVNNHAFVSENSSSSGYVGDNTPTSGSPCSDTSQVDEDCSSPFSTSPVNEFNTSLCLDEATFEVGEDSLTWLEEALVKSLQQEAQDISVSVTSAAGPSQKQQSHSNHLNHNHVKSQDTTQGAVPVVLMTSALPNDLLVTSPEYVLTTETHNPHTATSVGTPVVVVASQTPAVGRNKHSYTSIATDHDYSAKPGDRVKGQGQQAVLAARHHVHTQRRFQNSPIDIEMFDDVTRDAASFSSSTRNGSPQISRAFVSGGSNPSNAEAQRQTKSFDSSILVALLGHNKNLVASGRYSTTKQQHHPGNSSRTASSTSSNNGGSNSASVRQGASAARKIPGGGVTGGGVFPAADMLGASLSKAAFEFDAQCTKNFKSMENSSERTSTILARLFFRPALF